LVAASLSPHLFGILRISLHVESGPRPLVPANAGVGAPTFLKAAADEEHDMLSILWIILIGLIAGVIARLISPGPNNPRGFVLTTLLGVAGAFLATWLGQLVGWYRADQGARFIGATVGALLILFIWNRLVARGLIGNQGDQRRLR
jgi:uncharacterized membrane protein YeaQ/YmgE (transglycosylase-associated protein family)